MIEKFKLCNPGRKYTLIVDGNKLFDFIVKESCEDLFLIDSGKTIDSDGQLMFADEKFTVKDLGCFNTDSYTASVKTAAYTERTATERIKERVVIPEGFLRRFGGNT